MLKALREAAHELESQLWGLDEDDVRRRPSEDELSLKEIAGHLRDCEEHLLECLERIVDGDNPQLPAFDADMLLLEQDYGEIDLYEAMERFEYLRHRTVSLLWSLEGDDWERTGSDPYRGVVSITQLAREQNEHDLEHLWQARRVREGLVQGAPSSR
ncbi:MAG: DinB family protein [Dehalococcoidia bacterium]